MVEGSGSGSWTRHLVQLMEIQSGIRYLGLDNAGCLWDIILKHGGGGGANQGQMAVLEKISLFHRQSSQPSHEPEFLPWP